MIYINLIFLILAYLIGSIPFGLILNKVILGVDIRKFGSGNIGATNALRIGGKKIGVSTLLLDSFKGIIVIILFKLFNQNIYLGAALAIIGHVFPIWLNFKGGKGVATMIGVVTLINFYVGIATIFSWIICFLITKTSSLSSIAAVLISLVFAYISKDINLFYLNLFFAILIIYKHKANIKRLIKGQENKFKG